MAKSKLHIGFLLGLALLATACTEEITMDMPEGRKRPVVEGSITDEFKRHEVILSYSSEMYDTDDPEMISGAEVYVRIGSDTIWFYEQDNKPGHYLSDSVSGRRNRCAGCQYRNCDELFCGREAEGPATGAGDPARRQEADILPLLYIYS